MNVRNAPRPVDELTRAIWDALAQDGSFRTTLRLVGKHFRSHVTALHAEEFAERNSELILAGELNGNEFSQMAEEYSTRWLGKNLWMERGRHGLISKGWDLGEETVSNAELLQSEYYRRFLAPVDVRHGMGMCLRRDAVSSLVVLSLNRSASAGPFMRDELRTVAAIRTHLASAYVISQQLGESLRERELLRASLDAMPFAVLLLDGACFVIHANDAAERLLMDGRAVFRSAKGQLRARLQDVDRRLSHAVSTLTDVEAPERWETILTQSTCASPQLLRLHVLKIPGRWRPGTRAKILIIIRQINALNDARPDYGAIKAFFGLTPTEALVLKRLCENFDSLRVAADLKVSISTVRSHLKHLFRKTGTARQSELIALIHAMRGIVKYPGD
jgi:DNA-binding CsgD family transcriptional regulator/PAS domain-containing protein